jgi:proline racemase
VDKEHHVTWRVDFYDKADGLLKVLQAEGLVQVGEAWRFDSVTVTNVQAGSKTVMTVTGRGEGKIDPSIFSPSALDSW